MTYKEAINFINQSNVFGSILGLESIIELLNKLDNPQDKLKVIHIAGTNGKGSTAAFISGILSKAGYRVGRYISPAVFDYKEIIQIEDCNKSEYITEEGIAQSIKIIKAKSEELFDQGYRHPTTFEIETAMAFMYFLDQKVDFVILEVGLGGRLDATNVIKKPLCSVFTSISLDHMNYLGETLEEIVKEKSGIIKENSTVIAIEQNLITLEVIENYCNKKQSKYILADYNDENIVDTDYIINKTSFGLKSNEGIEKYQIKLLGKHQIKNAVLAIKVIKYLVTIDYNITENDIKEGISGVNWPGRFEIISEKPYFIIDGAHNPEAALMLKESVELYFKDKKIILILGVLADKDYIGILSNLSQVSNKIITVTPNNPRALKASELAIEASEHCQNVIIADSAINAVEDAYDGVNDNDVIIACGTLTFLKEIKEIIKITRTD
ncbi:MAG TPA: bifunctional folylpolyglutamate synthase/dihydrofolate synthase [Clostridiales bacterium]|nr:bifunctional folylpolyglutamate synthase/dihydrofolate synthase [Clostridiales bacterium]